MENQTFKTKVDSEENISPNKRKREPEPSFNDLISPNHVVANQSRQENEPEESEEHPNILSPPPVGRRMRSAGSISVSEQLGTSGMEEFQNRMIPTEDEVNANDSTFIAAPSAPAVADDASVSSGVANPNHDKEESESLLLCHEISSSVSTPPGIINTRVPSRQTCVTNCHCASTGDDEANDEALATVNILMTFGDEAEVEDNEADEDIANEADAVANDEDIANEADAVANDGDIANEADAVANDGNEGYDVGCKLVKYFQGHGWYEGEIKEIRLEAEKNKTRRVFYSDGDWEDLSIKEIKKARKSYANKLIQDRKKVTSNTNTSNEASKKTKNQKKKNKNKKRLQRKRSKQTKTKRNKCKHSSGCNSLAYADKKETADTPIYDPSDKINAIHAHNTVVIPEYKLLFFTFPKVACTEWKELGRRGRGFAPSQGPYGATIHGDPAVKRINNFSTEEVQEMLTSDDWTRATIVRDPKERVLSAFLDKFTRNKIEFERWCCRGSEEEVEFCKQKQEEKDFHYFLHRTIDCNNNEH